MSTVLHSSASSTKIAPTTPTTLPTNTTADAPIPTPTPTPADEEVLGTSSQAIIACNSISIAACVLVIVVYALLHRKHARLMQRTSLVLSCAMAASDLLLHVAAAIWCFSLCSSFTEKILHQIDTSCSPACDLATNLVGYFNLPPGFACAFIGGWLYAFPTLLSVFYSCCIALNSQLYFVFRREPQETNRGISTLLKWYIFTPIAVSGILCFSALAAGLYGYDSAYGYCWFASPPEDPDHPHQRHIRPLIGMVTTWGGWCLLALFYLLVASSTVAWVVFFKSSDVDFGGHLGLRRNRRKFTTIHASSASDPPWAGYASTNSTDMEVQKKGRPHIMEFGDREKASLTPVDDVKRNPSDIHDGSEMGRRAQNNEQAGEMDSNIHIFPPTPRYPSDAAHSQRSEAINTAPLGHQERPKISRRTLALRAMTLRLIGYILTPVICVLPSTIRDLVIKAFPVGHVEIPDCISGLFDGLNGLVGLFNAVLFLVDPALLVLWAELRANYHWGALQRQRADAQSSNHENRNAIETDVVAKSPLPEAETPGRDVTQDQVAGIQFTHLGREDTPRGQLLAKRAFDDSLVSNLQKLDFEQRSLRLTQADPTLPRLKGMGRRKLHRAHSSGGAGLMIHVQVEVTKCSDLERVEDYLHGL